MVKVLFRKSESLEIDEGAHIPEEYLRFKEPDIERAELKRALKSGAIHLDGVRIIENNNIQIK